MLTVAARRALVHLVPRVASPEVAARPFAATLQPTSSREIASAGVFLAAAAFPVGTFLLVLLTAALR